MNTAAGMDHVAVSTANPYLVLNLPFAKVDSSGWSSYALYAVDVSLHNTILWRHFHRYSDFALLHEQLADAAGSEYSRILPSLPPKVFSPLNPDVVRERQQKLVGFLRELLSICRNDFGEELLGETCRPVLDAWLVTDPIAPAGAYAPFRHQFPIVKGTAAISAPLSEHRLAGGLWLALVAAIRIQTRFRSWQKQLASGGGVGLALPPAVPTHAAADDAAAAPVPRSPRDLRPMSRSVAIDQSPCKPALIDRESHRAIAADPSQGNSLMLEQMRTMSGMGIPLLAQVSTPSHHSLSSMDVF